MITNFSFSGICLWSWLKKSVNLWKSWWTLKIKPENRCVNNIKNILYRKISNWYMYFSYMYHNFPTSESFPNQGMIIYNNSYIRRQIVWKFIKLLFFLRSSKNKGKWLWLASIMKKKIMFLLYRYWQWSQKYHSIATIWEPYEWKIQMNLRIKVCVLYCRLRPW